MKKNLLLIAVVITALNGALPKDSFAAERKSNTLVEKVKNLFSKDYRSEDLMVILADIQNDIKNSESESLAGRDEEIRSYLSYRDRKITKHDQKYSPLESGGAYIGDRVLEIKYGKWPHSHQVILPLTIKNKPLMADLTECKKILAGFEENEIESATVRYVRYDVGNSSVGIHLRHLLNSIKTRKNADVIESNISDIYDDVLIDHKSSISLVTQIRDNLAVAKYMLDNHQPKVAQSMIGTTDSVILRLIEIRSSSPDEQEKIKNLRKELKNISRISDENYLSKWEEIVAEAEDWWNKK